LRLKAYPAGWAEIMATGEQTLYRKIDGLSNSLGGVVVTVIPTGSESPVTLFVSGSLYGRVYHQAYNRFDNNYGEISVAADYELLPSLSLRQGLSYRATRYLNAGLEYKRDLDVYFGANLLLPAANVLDVEAGFSATHYPHKDLVRFIDSIPPGWDFPLPYQDWLMEWIGNSGSDLLLFHFSPRVSRPLGPRTGLTLTFTDRIFQNYSHQTVFGFNTGSFSPWASVWQGTGVSASLKTFLIPRLIVTAGAGYWQKRFLRSLEGRALFINQSIDRHDWQSRLFLTIQAPVKPTRALLVEPTITVDYVHNDSRITSEDKGYERLYRDFYRYRNWSVSAGIRIRL
jgi:hypothetical protein